MVFTSIGHLINIEMLADCHIKMDGKKAVGIDGVTKDEYNKDLEKNLFDLMDRMKSKAYHPKSARRVEIPKDNGKTRPLSIYCYEDKLVQEAIKYLPQLGNRGAYLYQRMSDKLVEHKQYIHHYGMDLPEVAGWKWER